MDWRDDLRAHFPAWGTEAARRTWPGVRARLAVGQEVAGVVVARVHSGVWLDIGVGHPALLLVTEMEPEDRRRRFAEDYPALGSTIMGRISAQKCARIARRFRLPNDG